MLKRTRLRPVGLLFIVYFSLSAPVAAQKKIEILQSAGPLESSADQLAYDRENETLTLIGNVKIVKPPWIIYADELEINLRTNLAKANKGLKIVRTEAGEEKEIISAEQAEINLETQTGLLVKGRLTLPTEQGRITVQGDKIERLSENQFLFKPGSFTSCQCQEGEKPDWEVKAKKIDADTKKSAKLRLARICVRDKTILYAPYLEYPISQERKSGFLTPDIGYSSRSGYQAGLPYYQVLGDAADMTLYPYWLQKRGFLAGADFRHNLGPISTGRAEGFAINDGKESRFRWFAAYKGESSWKSGWLREEISPLSDNEYIVDFDQDVSYRWQREQKNRAVFSQNLPGSNLSGEFTYFDDLAGWDLRPVSGWRHDQDNTTIHLMPEINYQIFNRPLAGPVGFDMLNTFDYFYRQKAELGRGAELDLSPRLIYSPRLGSGLRFFSFTGYQASVLKPDAQFSDSTSLVGRALAGANLGVGLEKYFHQNDSAKNRYRHLIEPQLIVFWNGETNEPEDRFFRQIFDSQEVGLAGMRVSNLVFQKPVKAVESRLVSEVELNQFYDFVRGEVFDLELKSLVQLPDRYGLNSDYYYNLDQGQLHRIQASAWVQDSRGDRFWLGYLFAQGRVQSSWYAFDQSRGEDWRAGTDLKLSRNLNLGYQMAYSQRYNRLVSQSLLMKYLARQNCWTADLRVSERINPEQPEKNPEYSLAVNFQILVGSKVQLPPGWSDVQTSELGPAPGQ